MTREERELVFIELSSRTPYGVYCNIDGDKRLLLGTRREDDDVFASLKYPFRTGITDKYGVTYRVMEMEIGQWEIRPYLRPLSDMTEEEEIYYNTVFVHKSPFEKLVWLNSHHFDYRDLITSGVAIKAEEGMYKFD